MSSIEFPTYTTNSDQFNIEFYKHNDESLSLTTAKKYFVQLIGVNILKGFYYFRNAINCDDSVDAEAIVCNTDLVSDKITSTSIVSQTLTCKTLVCDELIVNKQTDTPPSIYGFIYYDGMSLPITSSISDIHSFCGLSIQPGFLKILLLSNTKLICSNLYERKLLHNKHSKQSYIFILDTNKFNSFALYHNNKHIP